MTLVIVVNSVKWVALLAAFNLHRICSLNIIRSCSWMQGAVNFALMMSQLEGGCPVDYNVITDLFLQVWMSVCSCLILSVFFLEY